MNQILLLLRELLEKKENESFKNFLKPFNSPNLEWYLISDYCIDDTNKLNDVFSFSLLLNHDEISNIKDFIKAGAPKDIKNAKDVGVSFLSYVNSSVIYHFSFIIPRNNKLLKGFYSKEMMTSEISFINQVCENSIIDNTTGLNDYLKDVQKRIKQIKIEMQRPTFNETLMRKILLTGIFGASIANLLKINSTPSKVLWISDRDAIIDKYDGFAFDFMFMHYLLLPTDKYPSKDKFEFMFSNSGQTFYDELIRIPDYYAGTLASIDLNDKRQLEELHNKHKTFVRGSIVNSINQANIKLECTDSKLSVYNTKWVI
ncbi:hypothetical protein Q1W71_23700 [Flavobacterium pectinovorum]|uniref:hypothetical protein n=1 Tax=Flavobacterium pectinovorum TaxID=29533 RepID=UPI00265EF17B|nr:hypothetical protein [Flavobacterium pectinovorum]WKL47940.1 hypothetical protein Q1W71_23700 [Flavobacterium pectinovorum]